MMFNSKCIFLVLLPVTAILFAPTAAGQDRLSGKDANHVVLISVDGFAAYHLENEKLALPNLRQLIKNGVWAKSSQTIFPSVTHPSHATLITGVSPRKHGVLDNEMVNRETGESYAVTTRTHQQAIHAPTLFDAAHDAGLTTAAFAWPETRGDSSLDFNILHGHDELKKSEVSASLLQTLRDANVPIDTYYDIAPLGTMVGGYRDFILAQSAAVIIKSQRPALTAVYFALTDKIQHAFGPDHYLSHAALTQTDYHIGMIIKAVKEAGMEDRTTFLIVADHGFHTVTKEVNIYPLVKASGLADKVKLHGGGWNIFLETTTAYSKKHDSAALNTLFAKLMKIKGMHRIVRNEEFHEIGYPHYEEDPHVRGQYIIIPDINTYLVVDTSSTSAQPRERKPSHSHGYLPDHPRMFPALVLSGNGIRRGQRIGSVHNLDIAPTIADILGLSMTGVEGRVVREAFEK